MEVTTRTSTSEEKRSSHFRISRKKYLQFNSQEMVRCAAQHVAAALLRGHLRGLPRHRRLGHVVLRDQQREHAQERDTPLKTNMTQ